MPKGGARHFAKPYLEPSVLLQVLEKHQGLVKDLGQYELVSRNAAINPEGIVKCRHMLADIIDAAPCAEIHTSSLRSSLMSLLSKKGDLNQTSFNGSTWANTKTERFSTLLNHVRKLARDERSLNVCAAKLCGKDFDRLKKVVAKVQVKDEPLRKEAEIEVELDEKGFPKMLESPPAVQDPLEKRGRSCAGSPLQKRGRSCGGSPLQKRGRSCAGSPGKKKAKSCAGSPLEKRSSIGGEAASSSRPKSLWQRDGAMCSLQEAMGLTDEEEKRKKKEPLKKRPAAKSEKSPAKRRFWKKITFVDANKPKPRAYLQGCYEGESKKRLICEVSVSRTTQYKKIVQITKEQCEQKGLTKQEALVLRDKLCEKYPSSQEFHL